MGNLMFLRCFFTRIVLITNPIIQKIGPRGHIINRVGPLPLPTNDNLVHIVTSLKLPDPLLVILFNDQK